MSNGVIALFGAIGAAAWVYAQMMRRTGSNVQNSLIISGLAALGVLVLLWTILNTVVPN